MLHARRAPMRLTKPVRHSRTGRQVSRREFVKRAVAAGLVLPGIGELAAGCGSAAGPQPTAPPAQPAAKSAGLDQIIEAAKREGELHWIDVSVQQFNDDRFHGAFKRMFGLPDSFRLRHTLTATGDVVTQVQQEVQAGNVTVDFVWIGDLAFWKGIEGAGALLDYAPSELSALEPMLRRLNFPTQPPRWWTITSYCFAPAWNKRFVSK